MRLWLLLLLLLAPFQLENKGVIQGGESCNNELVGFIVTYDSDEIYFVSSKDYDDNIYSVDKDELVTSYSASLVKTSPIVAFSDFSEKLSSNVDHQVKITYSYISETYPPQIIACDLVISSDSLQNK
ncbi:hypothetical protein AB1K91_07085 [Terribacillus sp. 179-K 1B1 HS]|uniref:hypothetical protein n=1 Tax=Terribacillus sp. 179-K 1B1 HS TaxID=3142388 RepID=UPI0039A38BB8